ncbi:MAG: hypothetical protein ACO1N0_10525 [Fluviicola sp.]
MNIPEFKQNLGVSELPVELEKLIQFQNEQSDFECYSEGFGLQIDDKSGIDSWSKDEAFLERLFPFAQANGTGSVYAFWNEGSSNDLSEFPIVVFGDEGGVHVIAENFLALMQLLTFDSEISVYHDEVYFYKEEDESEESEDHAAYVLWLKENFNLDPLSETETLVQRAQKKYKSAFDTWFANYYAG